MKLILRQHLLDLTVDTGSLEVKGGFTDLGSATENTLGSATENTLAIALIVVLDTDSVLEDGINGLTTRQQ